MYPGQAQAAPSAPPAMGGEMGGPKELFTICIEVYDDGTGQRTFKVGKDTPESEAMPEQAAEGATEGMPDEVTEDQGYQDAATADEALKLAAQLIGGDQAAPDASTSMQAGFAKARGLFKGGM